MSLISARPRLLPPTIVAMAALLGVKSASLVRAAIPSDVRVASATATAALPAPASAPAPTPAAAPALPPSPAPAPSSVVLSPAQMAGATPATAAPACPPPPSPSDTSISDSERALLVDLRARRGELDAREAALNARVAVQDAAEKRLEARANDLTALQQRLEALEAARREHDDTNWRGLVKLYENMRPRDAATIFNDLDLPVLLQVVDRMKEAKAAQVLASMQPERARLLTAELAQLRARANSIQGSGKTGPGETQR
jgi:flagellar motility protein MotE (MotC chaperone)